MTLQVGRYCRYSAVLKYSAGSRDNQVPKTSWIKLTLHLVSTEERKETIYPKWSSWGFMNEHVSGGNLL